ncbi:MAG: hypothetical protein J6W76_07425, partial [Spirochaetales bacterium]|nr:hypothetical protein [Spirochaetales bacterium]
AKDVGDNASTAQLYFIYDKTSPSGMEITSPLLLDKTGIDDLTNDPNEIDMVKIAYYLNNGDNDRVTVRGIGNDAGKVKDTTIDIYSETDDQIKYSIIIDLSDDNLVWEAKAGDASWDGITDLQGVPSNYSMQLDTRTIPDGNYYMKITSEDVAGNVGFAYTKETDKRYFKIMQDADKPRVSFFTSDNDKVYTNYKVKGMAYDDDGFDESKKFRYALGCNASESDMQNAWDNPNSNQDKVIVGEFAPENSSKYTFEVPVPCSDDGKWTLWLLPIDKYGKKGNIYRLNLNVSSSEMPIVESIAADNTADGFKFGDIYAGNMEIMATLYAGSDKKNVSEVWYRAYTSQSEARANNDLKADIASFDTEHQKGKWYIHQVTAGSRYTDRVKINNKNFIADGVTGQLIIEVKVYNNDKDESPVNILPIVVDHEKPSISIMTPVADSTIDGSVFVSGTLSDLGSEIENVYISYYDQTWTDGDINALTVTSFSGAIPNGNNPEVGKWYELGA